LSGVTVDSSATLTFTIRVGRGDVVFHPRQKVLAPADRHRLLDLLRERRVPLGEYKELSAKGIPKTGTANAGGLVSTTS
jgi:hypothetical protein